ncbi:MAG: GAF domain-containing protein, partial [Caldimicrobium sp.]
MKDLNSILCEKLNKVFFYLDELLLKTSSLDDLFQGICKVLVETLDLKMAWIGEVNYELGKVIPLFYYGFEEGYLSEIQIVIDPNLPQGRGPTATALRKG